jgi:hypothetical protein
MEKVFSNGRTLEDVYASPDSIIHRSKPCVHVSNLGKYPVVINKGQVLGTAHNPRNWLTQASQISEEEYAKVKSYANLIAELVESSGNLQEPKPKTGDHLPMVETVTTELKESLDSKDDYLDCPSEEPLEGGPKSHGTPPEFIKSQELLSAVDVSKDLTPKQVKELAAVLTRNEKAFGLDGHLGNYKGTELEIHLRPGAKEISLPPYGSSSPAKREVMDKQIDTWLNLGVISPSKSPWGAPAFIVYRNGKPRMVIDYRKLNEITIPDEFPLPRQEDILQTLTGSQWLSTLDALAGFTQVSITQKDKEKTAFRSHRGLHQFNRMPFGLKNGPSTFQRIMQKVLAPFLWIFALVYIDDIVVFSFTFEDHLKHLDSVFQAIHKAGITLSPDKCHFAYQSLLLLGQKVSRLGLSTHKEKVDAIVKLAEPRNVSELQTFLGMMVYFSAYIPFYAWIVHPLFTLLRKDTKWKWEQPQSEAFELCKQVLTNAPVRAYAIEGIPYRIYSDACDLWTCSHTSTGAAHID